MGNEGNFHKLASIFRLAVFQPVIVHFHKCSRCTFPPSHRFCFFVCLRASSQDCFSMTNVSWYGGASVRGQTWPINDQNATTQPFTVSDLKDNPSGFGSALERYFLGSSGKEEVNRSEFARVGLRSTLNGGRMCSSLRGR